MRAASRTGVQTSVAKIGPDAAVFLAQRKGHMLRFASVAREAAFTGAAQAYIGELAVAAWAEGWARERGLRLLVLNTGAANERGRHFYVRSGFQEESVRLTKVLNEPGPTV
jgi:hypothetical protein